MFTLTYVDLEYEPNISCWDIWNDYRTLVIDWLLFQLATRLNAQKTYAIVIHNEIWHVNSYWILVIPIGIIEVTNTRKWFFWLYISSLHDYWPPSTWYSLLPNSWEKWRDVNYVLFSSSKCQKKISWNIKTKCVTDFLFFVKSSSMKYYTYHYEVST